MKTKKRADKGIWIGGGICGGVCLLLILALLLAAPVSAQIRLNKAKDILKQAGEVNLIITDPKQSGSGLFSTAEIVLSGDEAFILKEQLYDIVQNCSFKDTEEASAGIWLPYVTVSSNGGKETVRFYLEEHQIVLAHGSKWTAYQIKGSATEAYNSFYQTIIFRLKSMS